MNKKFLLIGLIALPAALAACASASREPEAFFEPAIGLEAPVAQSDLAFEESAPASRVAGNFADEVAPQGRVVIHSANMSIVVPEPAASVQEISRLAADMGGFVVSSNVFQQFFSEAGISADRASITIRVPSERLEEALERIREGATEIQSESISGQDVTREFTDLESRLRNLEAAEEQLSEIMSNADRTEDVLIVFENLRQVREQIEVTKGRIQYLSESARLSAIAVELIPDVAAQPLEIGGWRPEGTVKEAFTALIQALRFLGNAAIWGGICVVWWAVPLYFVVRSARRRRATAKAESSE